MDTTARYLSLLKKSLTNQLYIESEARLAYFVSKMREPERPSLESMVGDFLDIKSTPQFALVQHCKTIGAQMIVGAHGVEDTVMRNFTSHAHTMIGIQRIENLHWCLDQVRADSIPGDLIETGVWRGGATIFMRGFLAAHGLNDRSVWVADSFEGLPKTGLAQDRGIDFSKEVHPYLAVGLEEVQALFARYDLLDEQVKFLKGWFKDTLPTAPIERLALLRLDGDLYTSTWDALKHLYPKLSPGGFVIVDDYFSFPVCQEAVDAYRMRHRIQEPLVRIDEYSVYWRKT
ncbi:MAG: TylF/MycF family methyltransferase [Burkholderiales bacterium]|nr:TylF/MycF family methyltransferase [Burkholderiales bacterium]